MQKSKSTARMFLALIILLFPFEIAMLIGLWPYLPIVGQAIAGLFVTCCFCGALYVAGITWQRLHRPQIIVEGDVVVLLTPTGGHIHLSAEHEASKRPLMLPAPQGVPVKVTEEKPTAGELEVLTLLSKGESQRKVADACGISQTKVSEIKRKWQHQTGMID